MHDSTDGKKYWEKTLQKLMVIWPLSKACHVS